MSAQTKLYLIIVALSMLIVNLIVGYILGYIILKLPLLYSIIIIFYMELMEVIGMLISTRMLLKRNC